MLIYFVFSESYNTSSGGFNYVDKELPVPPPKSHHSTTTNNKANISLTTPPPNYPSILIKDMHTKLAKNNPIMTLDEDGNLPALTINFSSNAHLGINETSYLGGRYSNINSDYHNATNNHICKMLNSNITIILSAVCTLLVVIIVILILCFMFYCKKVKFNVVDNENQNNHNIEMNEIIPAANEHYEEFDENMYENIQLNSI